MNTLTRLIFGIFSCIAIALFIGQFNSSDNLSDGKIMWTWSLIPASLMLATVAFYTKERENLVVYLAFVFLGLFFVAVGFGSHKQSGDIAYFILFMLGICLSACGLVLLLLETIFPSVKTSRG